MWSVECRSWHVITCRNMLCLPWIMRFGPIFRDRRLSQSAKPATQNRMTASFDTFEKNRLCSFPIDTTKREDSQRLETRHVGAYHGICNLSPLHTALTLQFAENAQGDMSEVLRLPRKIKIDKPKCCACHKKGKIIF